MWYCLCAYGTHDSTCQAMSESIHVLHRCLLAQQSCTVLYRCYFQGLHISHNKNNTNVHSQSESFTKKTSTVNYLKTFVTMLL